MTEVTSADFAVIVYREDDVWEAELLPPAVSESLDGLLQVLRQQPSIGGTIGLAAVGDDFFVALRVVGSQTSVFLSDLTASGYWPLARQILDYLDIPVPDDEDDIDQVLPVGDLSIFADLGIDEMELGAISGDLDMYPSEALESIANITASEIKGAEDLVEPRGLLLNAYEVTSRALLLANVQMPIGPDFVAHVLQGAPLPVTPAEDEASEPDSERELGTSVVCPCECHADDAPQRFYDVRERIAGMTNAVVGHNCAACSMPVDVTVDAQA